MKYKYIALILILCCFAFLLSGCDEGHTVDQFSYIIAIGLDKGDSHKIKLSLQFPIANGSESSGGSSQSANSVVHSVECSSIEEGINLMNNYVGKPINLAHCKVIVFSEEIAAEGLSPHIYTLTNSIQMRPISNIIVSRCPASDYIENAKSPLEELSARYYESIFTSTEQTGYIVTASLSDFFYSLNDTTKQPIAVLGDVNYIHSDNTENASSSESNKYKAGQTPINSDNSIENSGLAVFKEDKLVGELDNIQTMCFSMVTNILNQAIITIPNPFDNSETIDLQITRNNPTSSTVSTLNTNPYIEVNLQLSAQVLSITEDSVYLRAENLPRLEEAVNGYLEKNVSEFLYKTSKEYHSDICGFAKEAIKNFWTWDKWESYNWHENYENAVFKVKASTNIRSGRLFTDS